MKTSLPTRRQFLHSAACAAGVAALAPLARAARRDLNSEIRIGIIGLGNKGGQHVGVFSTLAGARITALCDVDPVRLAAQVEKLAAKNIKPFSSADPRRVIERDDVDAVIIAAPNHWHALMTLWAIRAGKDVYVEKPVSHNVAEGVRMTAEAAARGVIVQSGLQFRSCPGLRAAAAWIGEGHIGKPHRGHIVWYENRKAIGKVAPHTPPGVDYDLWCGPAPLEPLTRPKLHYDWHWVWSTGDGDVGNSSVHAFDACRMFLPKAVFPPRVLSLGGRFTYDDAGQTPNTQFTVVDYPSHPILVENRNLSSRKDTVAMDHLRGIREGFVLHCEGGYFAGLRGGGKIYDNAGKELQRFQGDGGAGHAANFLAAIRSRRAADLHCPIGEGHVSSAVCHLGNISYRLGQPGNAAAARAAVGGSEFVGEALDRVVRSLEGLGLDLDKTPLTLGPWLECDPKSGGIKRVGSTGDQRQLAQAQALARGTYRAPFALPA
jgi:predicted dehydrogenase